MKLLGMAVIALLWSVAWGQDKEKGGIVLKHGMFSRELGMLDTERDEYASHLAAQAANQLAGGEKGQAGRLLVLAKLLSPRNKRVLAVDSFVEQGTKPERVKDAFTPESLARLLLTRGKLLVDEKGAESHWVGRAFVELAVELDPKNRQAVRERENLEFDFGEMDWSLLGGKE